MSNLKKRINMKTLFWNLAARPLRFSGSTNKWRSLWKQPESIIVDSLLFSHLVYFIFHFSSCLLNFPLISHALFWLLPPVPLHHTHHNAPLSFSPFPPLTSALICCCIFFSSKFPPLPLSVSSPSHSLFYLTVLFLSITPSCDPSCSFPDTPLCIFSHHTIMLNASQKKHAVMTTRTLQHTYVEFHDGMKTGNHLAHTHTHLIEHRAHTNRTPLPCQNLSLWVRGEFIRQDGLELQCGPDCRGSSRL